MGLHLRANSAGDFPIDQRVPARSRWVIPGWKRAASSTYTIHGSSIFYIPIFVASRRSYDRIAFRVMSAAAAGHTADIRIFSCKDGLPDALLLSCGTVGIDSTGYKELAISPAITFERGWYFLAYLGTESCGISGLDRAQCMPPALETKGGHFADSHFDDFVMRATGAAYADPAPAPTTHAPLGAVCLYLQEVAL